MQRKRRYKGTQFVICGDKLSKYAREKLAITHNWGLVEIVDKLDYGKVKINVYYFDLSFPKASINYISTEIVDGKDICELNWPMVKYLYNTQGHNYIIKFYLRYLELFDTLFEISDDDFIDYINVYDYKTQKLLKSFEYGDYSETNTVIQDWMMRKVDSNELDLDNHIKNIQKIKFCYETDI